MNSIPDEKLAVLRAELEQAEAKISSTLIEEPEAFHSTVELRRQLDQARAMKFSDSQRLALLREQEQHDLAETA